MDWYFVEQGKPLGMSEAEFRRSVAEGRVGPDTFVWRPGWPEWHAYGDLASAAETAPAIGEPGAVLVLCGECRGRVPFDEAFAFEGRHVCTRCKSSFLQRVREGGRIRFITEFAGFWERAAAKIVDGLVVTAASLILMGITMAIPLAAGAGSDTMGVFFVLSQLVIMVGQIGIIAAYSTYMIGRYGATLGKMALRIRVVRGNGDKVGYPLALGRFGAEYLDQMTLYAGYLLAIFDREKRTLHDMICNTRVVKK